MRYSIIYLLLLSLSTIEAVNAQQPQVDGATTGSPAAGEMLWSRVFSDSGKQRSCASCHGKNPGVQGKHVATGKTIEPMSPLVNPGRLTDMKKVAKWFKRNCKWTMGRECTSDEKRDFIAYLNNWKEL